MTVRGLDRIKRDSQYLRNTIFLDLSERYVGGEGESNNPIAMVIGEAPGAQEEIQRRPFVGPAGLVLRDLMATAGLNANPFPLTKEIATNCWLTNVVKFRPPKNRKPTNEEISAFRRDLLNEWLAIGHPRIIIPVGSPALNAVCGIGRRSILKVAGQLIYQPSRTRPDLTLCIWPMVHPSFVMRSNSTQLQEVVERDWQRLGGWLADQDEYQRATVYVDYYPEWLGVPKKWEGGGHLLATDLNALHSFAKLIGLKREWFQVGVSGFPHYDLTKSKRALAIIKGAIPIEPGEIPEGVIRRVF